MMPTIVLRKRAILINADTHPSPAAVMTLVSVTILMNAPLVCAAG
jgi:hypothetical protein